MNIVVLGATGKTGQIVMKLLLEHEHNVTAYVRNSTKIKIVHPHLQIIQGTLDDYPRLVQVFREKDALISCLGLPTPGSTDYIHPSAEIIQQALLETNLKRIIYLAAAGVHGEVPGIKGAIIEKFLKHVLLDHRQMLNVFMQNTYEYTIFRPVLLTKGKYHEKYKQTTHGIPGIIPISRQTIAHCIVLSLENNLWIRESIGLSR